MEATVEHELTEAQKRAAVLLAQGLTAIEVGRRVQRDEHTIGRWKKEASFSDAVKAAGDALDEEARAETAEFNAELRKVKREALRTLRKLLDSKEAADRLRAVDIALKA
jgi:negative regulator of replication initiation